MSAPCRADRTVAQVTELHVPLAVHPRLRKPYAAVGTRPFGTDVIGDALTGPFDASALAAMPLELPYAGKNGKRHFHPGCPPMDRGKILCPNPSYTRLALGTLLDELIPSLRHHCVSDFGMWLPEVVRVDLELFADAHLLTIDWFDAEDQSERFGRPCLPDDNTPVTSGLFAELIGSAQHHAALHPDRSHVERLVERLRSILAAWSDRLSRSDGVAAADPHSEVLRWQAAARLPELHGTPRQVRWAERIRFDASRQPGAAEVVASETDARVWIGLHTQDDVDDWAWREMRFRASTQRRRY